MSARKLWGVSTVMIPWNSLINPCGSLKGEDGFPLGSINLLIYWRRVSMLATKSPSSGSIRDGDRVIKALTGHTVPSCAYHSALGGWSTHKNDTPPCLFVRVAICGGHGYMEKPHLYICYSTHTTALYNNMHLAQSAIDKTNDDFG